MSLRTEELRLNYIAEIDRKYCRQFSKLTKFKKLLLTFKWSTLHLHTILTFKAADAINNFDSLYCKEDLTRDSFVL